MTGNRSDWVMCMIALLIMIATIVGNYIYHGGHLVW